MPDDFPGTLAPVIPCPLPGVRALLVEWMRQVPALCRRERAGLDGVRFRMYKFRAMKVGAEAESGAVRAGRGGRRGR